MKWAGLPHRGDIFTFDDAFSITMGRLIKRTLAHPTQQPDKIFSILRQLLSKEKKEFIKHSMQHSLPPCPVINWVCLVNTKEKERERED